MKRNQLLDILKGIAIIAVILYHCGVLKNGYLGVEIFLVTGGYLITKSIMRTLEGPESFGYWKYLNKRLVRLWPMLLLISVVSLALGWLWMLPIHYKLTCEAAAGTSVFCNNFIQYITSGNYWMSDNDYKPLMHTWYVGIVFQFYVLYPFIFIIAKKCAEDWKRVSFYIVAGVFILSLCLYVSPLLTTAQNFYLLPSRLFELAIGGMVALYPREGSEKGRYRKVLFFVALVFVLFMILNPGIDEVKSRVIITVAVSALFVILAENGYKVAEWPVLKSLAFLGVASYSLYLPHQVLFAFYRYAFNDVFSIKTYIGILAVAFAAGLLLYVFIEKPLAAFSGKGIRNIYLINSICAAVTVLIFAFALYYYKNDGMVRDIPELEMYLGKNSETPYDYNGRTFRYDTDFEENGRKNILVIGDSFGRDWINVLLESGVDSKMNISYHTDVDDILKSRIEKADYIFIASNESVFNRYGEIIPAGMRKKFYRVGIKNYSSWIGNIYNNDRYGRDYYSQKVRENRNAEEINEHEREIFRDRYIDMMTPLKDSDGMINIFTSDHRLITEDGLHITRAGAELYAGLIDVWKYLE